VLLVGTSEQISQANILVKNSVDKFLSIIIETVKLPSVKMAIALFGKGGERINALKAKSECLMLKIDTTAQTITVKAFSQDHVDSAKILIAEKIKEIEAEEKRSRFILKLQREKERRGAKAGTSTSRGGTAGTRGAPPGRGGSAGTRGAPPGRGSSAGTRGTPVGTRGGAVGTRGTRSFSRGARRSRGGRPDTH